MQKTAFILAAFTALTIAIGAAWAVSSSTAESEGCCVTGNCCCPGKGACCDLTQRKPQSELTGVTTESCCLTGNCCCPGKGSCCAKPDAAGTTSCCSTKKTAE